LDRSTFSYDPKIYGDQGELGLSGYWQLNVKTVPDGQTATPSQWDDKDWTNKPMTVHRTATHPYRHIQQKSAVQAAVDFVGGGCG